MNTLELFEKLCEEYGLQLKKDYTRKGEGLIFSYKGKKLSATDEIFNFIFDLDDKLSFSTDFNNNQLTNVLNLNPKNDYNCEYESLLAA